MHTFQAHANGGANRFLRSANVSGGLATGTAPATGTHKRHLVAGVVIGRIAGDISAVTLVRQLHHIQHQIHGVRRSICRGHWRPCLQFHRDDRFQCRRHDGIGLPS